MALQLAAEPIPLRDDGDGALRVGRTRVTLDTVAAAFRQGATPEGIVEQYPTLELGQVYSVIGYMLNHPVEVEAYLKERTARSEAIRQENEKRFPPVRRSQLLRNLTLKLPKELEDEFVSRAQRRGITLSELALEILSAEVHAKSGPRTGADLVAYWQAEGLVGARKDLPESSQHARALRHQAETRIRS